MSHSIRLNFALAPAGISWLSCVAHGDALFVAVGGNGTVITSPDGSGWQAQTASTTQHLSDVAFGPGTLAW